MGDFQGHPFRGNQWSETAEGASSEPAGISRGDYLASNSQPIAKVPRGSMLAKPIQGQNGTSIVGYEWRSHIADVQGGREGGLVARRVSDWDASDISTGTGRDIVHVFYVQYKDGSITAEGVGSANRILGIAQPRLRTIATHMREAGERREREEESLVREQESRAKDTTREAARDLVERNLGLRSEWLEKLMSEALFLEKEGKFIKVVPGHVEALERRGWKRRA